MKQSGSPPSKTADEIAEEIRRAAREAPPLRPEHGQSMRAIVMRVADELEGMRMKGYNLRDLSKFLAGKGVPIAAPTLATYLRTHRLEKAGAGATKPGRKKANTG